MTSYPQSPGDGDNEQTRSSSSQGSGSGSGGYAAPGQPGQAGQGSGQPGYQPGGGYPPGSYQQGAYGQPGYPPGSYQQGAYPNPGAQSGYPSGTPQAGQPSYYSQPGYPGSYPAGQGGGGGFDGPPPSFFGALFDFSFSRFVTPSVIKVLYILSMILVLLIWLGYIVFGFLTGEPVIGLIAFVVGGVVALVSITYQRVFLEVLYAIVRMSEDIHNRR